MSTKSAANEIAQAMAEKLGLDKEAWGLRYNFDKFIKKVNESTTCGEIPSVSRFSGLGGPPDALDKIDVAVRKKKEQLGC